jgi:uncharacterized protein involved in exopolysaccharide biosynthesis
LIVARAELAEIEARLEQIQLLNVGNSNRVATMIEVLSSPMIQQLRSQELEALARRSELALEFGPRHPRMLQVQAELGEIRERIDLEVSSLITGLENEGRHPGRPGRIQRGGPGNGPAEGPRARGRRQPGPV